MNKFLAALALVALVCQLANGAEDQLSIENTEAEEVELVPADKLEMRSFCLAYREVFRQDFALMETGFGKVMFQLLFGKVNPKDPYDISLQKVRSEIGFVYRPDQIKEAREVACKQVASLKVKLVELYEKQDVGKIGKLEDVSCSTASRVMQLEDLCQIFKEIEIPGEKEALIAGQKKKDNWANQLLGVKWFG